MVPRARSFFERPALEVARDLLGDLLVHEVDGLRLAGRIVETEAYGQDDPGSHAFRGMTPRSAPMFEEPGHAYVYFTYGMHFCLNVVTDPAGVAGAVLLRAVEPLEGLEAMRRRRGLIRDRDLARGPGRLTQAFGISRSHNRADVTVLPLFVGEGSPVPEAAVEATPRIGLGPAQDGRPWRFVVLGSPWVSSAPSAARRR
ncbi:MAG: DNA-3-methyladenine glycosylase [Acidobacteria bacterium]|nr:DNA-3-methyladenine glycosylase [Acidobacteriota bacterium]